MSGECSCPHDPKQAAGGPIGQYHCPDCGAMVLAGYPHPSDDDVIDQGVVPYGAVHPEDEDEDGDWEDEEDDMEDDDEEY